MPLHYHSKGGTDSHLIDREVEDHIGRTVFVVDRAGFEPAAFRRFGCYSLANRTFFGPS